MLERRGKHRFFRTEVLFAILDGRDGCCCVQRLAISGQPGTEPPSQPNKMMLVTVFGSEVLMGPDLLKLSSSVIVLSGFVLQGLSFTAIIKSPVQYSKTFDSGNDVLFWIARVADVAADLFLCELVKSAVASE